MLPFKKVAEQIEPTGQKVFDPFLGQERDAFPGEVVSPEEEKIMQRLMREGEERFGEIYSAVKDTGEMSEEEMNAVLKAGKVYAQVKRREYLEAIRQNPANILRNILDSLKGKVEYDTQYLDMALDSLKENVQSLIKGVENNRAAARAAGRPITETVNYIPNPPYSTENSFVKIDRGNNTGEARSLFNQSVLDILRETDALPGENISSLIQLLGVIRGSGNRAGSGKPYIENYQGFGSSSNRKIDGLSATKPGLVGITFNVDYGDDFEYARNFYILVSEEAKARIVDGEQKNS